MVDALPVEELSPGLFGRVAVAEGAPRVLWIHGYTLDSSSFAELWARLPGFEHVGVDLPGHGASPALDPGANLVELGRSLAALCEARALQHVVALSFGTVAALQLLLERRLASAVLAAPGIAGGPTEPAMGPVYYKMGMLRAMVGRSPRITELWLGSPAFNGLSSRPGLRETVTRLVERHGFDELTDPRRAIAMHQPVQDVARLATIETPALVIAGDRELPAYREAAAILEKNLRSCRREELPDTDHLCLLQSPERAAPMIARHLADHHGRLVAQSQ